MSTPIRIEHVGCWPSGAEAFVLSDGREYAVQPHPGGAVVTRRDTGSRYQVDTTAGTCTCPARVADCVHLAMAQLAADLRDAEALDAILAARNEAERQALEVRDTLNGGWNA